MYTFCIHLMYTFCTSNLEPPNVYKKYTSPRRCILMVYMLHAQKRLQKVYFLYTPTKSILLYVGQRFFPRTKIKVYNLYTYLVRTKTCMTTLAIYIIII